MPWELPEGWCWTTIDTISESILYGVSESAKTKGKYKLLRITDIQNGHVDWQTVPYTDYDCTKANQYLLRENDILFARTGATVGKSYLTTNTPSNTIYASYLIRVRPSSRLLPQYVKYYFESGYYWEQISIKSVGVGQPNVNGSVLGELSIPIPPFAEQERIVMAATKFLHLIDAVEEEQKTLSEDSLRIKEQVLDLAIHGKLVPQVPSEEPAIELLRRINPAFKASDNLHYLDRLPNGWCFSTIGDIFQHNTGKALNGIDHEGVMLRYITTSNLYWDRFDLSEERTMPFTEKEQEKCRAQKGDLLVCEGGDIGRAAIWPYEENIMIQNHIHRLRPKAPFSVRFFYYIFYLYKQKGLIGGKGIGIQGLSSRELDKMVIPVPPVNEQHRIVTAIEEKFAMLDAIAECC